MAITSFLQLWDDLQTEHGIHFLLTSRLNQDCLENLFSTIRGKGGHGDNPSTQQFRIRLGQTMVDSFFVHSPSSNCEEDHDRSLLALNSMTDTFHDIDTQERKTSASRAAADKPLDPCILDQLCSTTIFASSYSDDSLRHVQENVQCYIAGFTARRLQGKVCQHCSGLLTGTQRAVTSEMLIAHKQFQNTQTDGLVFPSEQLEKAIRTAEDTYRKNIEKVLHTDNIKHRLIELMERSVCLNTTMECPEESPKKCQVLKQELKTFVNIRLHFTLKDCSRSFKGLARRNRKIMKLQHE